MGLNAFIFKGLLGKIGKGAGKAVVGVGLAAAAGKGISKILGWVTLVAWEKKNYRNNALISCFWLDFFDYWIKRHYSTLWLALVVDPHF